ncbi:MULTISPECIES: TonB-dependent receptor [Shewanella]|jgi:outer membrane cobalamin receptor|uniref:TonB-dependent receptor n=1 Tax=Shewanella TaxID=22 RepID=UPI001676064A|nr:TonB-dependent receptor [Shewanella fodinae]MCL2906695.1 TonB-dependent receptor [Shewanella fodinae]GGZ03096.1 TonB-dependent receptor [Shewanella fodinae]
MSGLPLKISAVALALGYSLAAQAQETVRDPLLNINDVMVVHGERGSAIKNSTTQWVITADEIRDLGAQSLDEVLKTVPGVYVRYGGEGSPRVDIRGFKTRHVMLLINGVPANGADDGQFDPSIIPTSQIASIDVSVGPTSVLYGPGGAGGVINIITKQGDSAPALSGHIEAGRNNTRKGDVSVAGSGTNWQGFVSGSYQTTDGFEMSSDYEPTATQDDETRLNSDKTLRNLYAQGNYWFNDDTQLIANMALRSGDWGKPPRDGSGVGSIKYERVDDYDGKTFQLGMAHKFNELLTLRGFGYYNEAATYNTVYTDATYKKVSEYQDGTSKVQGANVQLIADFGQAGTLSTSAIAEKQSWDALSESYSNTSSGSGSGGGSGGGSGSGSGGGSGGGSSSTVATFDDSAWVYTGAAEYQYQVDGNWGYTLGAAYHDMDRDEDSDNDYSAMASGFWQALDNTKLTLSAARKIRFPSMSDLYDLSSGNKDLQTEVSKTVEFGLNQGLGMDTEFEIHLFHTDTDNFIAKDSNSISQNLGDYRFQGFDTVLSNHSIDKLSLSLAYSYLDSKDKTANETRYDGLNYRPKHQLRFELGYELPTATRFHLSVERIMDQVYYQNQKVNGVKTAVEYSLDNYTLVDVNLTQPLGSNNLELYLRATNLLDENYYQSDSLPQPGREVFVGINWQI